MLPLNHLKYLFLCQFTDHQGKFHLQDPRVEDRDHQPTIEFDHLQKEIDNVVKQSKLIVESEETMKSNEKENSQISLPMKSSPEKVNTISGRPKERRHGLDNLALPKAAIVRRHSDNATGREAMQRNLSGLSPEPKISIVKPTSPPPPPPPRTPTKSDSSPQSPVKSPLQIRTATPTKVSAISSPVLATTPTRSPSSPSVISRLSSPVAATSPIKSPPPPPVLSRPMSPPAYFNTSTPVSSGPRSPLPPPPPDSTFSPTISPEAIDALPPPPPPEPIPPPLDTTPLPPPPPLESLSPVPPIDIPAMSDSPPPPPPVSPPPPPPLSPEGLLMAQKVNNNFDTTRDDNTSDLHTNSDIRINNMDITDNNNINTKRTNVKAESDAKKSLTFNVPSENIPDIHISDDDDSGDDVALPEFSDDSETSDTDSESSDDNNDEKKTYSYNFIPEEDEEEEEEDSTDTSFDLSPSPETTDRSYSAPPAVHISNDSSNDNSTENNNGNSKINEPTSPEADKTKKTPSRQDTLTVEFEEKIKTKEEEEEEEASKPKRSSRVSFGEYKGSPLPSKRGIL